jgi:pimeloyl-ACP methyl ester carboxylesterase
MDFEYPISTGFAFIDVANLVGTRDHFAQALLDLMQGVRVIKGADWAAKTGGYTPDGDDIVYLGMSLGGILGANIAALEPSIGTFVLNVPGADYLSIIENSATFETLFEHALSERNAPRGSDAYFEFANVIRWLLDPVDPLNIAPHATVDPLTYVDPVDGQTKTMPEKRVLIQMALDDAVVPNISTRILAERMGLSISVYEPVVANHGFIFAPTSEGGAARDEMVEFFNDRE